MKEVKLAVALVPSGKVEVEAVCRALSEVLYVASCTYVRAVPEEGEEALINSAKSLVVLVGCYEDGDRYSNFVNSYRAWFLIRCED